MKRPPPFNAVYVFAACARLGSFKRASEELNVTAGAVSRQIQSLESHLQFQLFERQFRSVKLTHAGQLYFSQVTPALRAIESAAELARDKASRIRLNVEATPTLAMHWLIPKLAKFQQQHPQLDLQLTTGSGPVLLKKDIDLYLRRDPSQFSGLTGEEFMTETSLLVCSPAFLRQHVNAQPGEIHQLPLVMTHSRPDLWLRWFQQSGKDINQVQQRTVLDNTILAIKATIEGLGIGLIPSLFIEDYLNTGTLLQLPQSMAIKTGSYSVLQPKAEHSQQSTWFRSWIHNIATPK